MQFFCDIKQVYPRFVDGNQCKGLELQSIDPPTVDSEGIHLLIPKKWKIIEEEIINSTDELNDNTDDLGNDSFY